MSATPDPLAKLWSAARRAPHDTVPAADLTPPPGFAGRVTARGAASAGTGWLTLWDRATRWGAVLAATACLLALMWPREERVPPWDALVSASSAELEGWRP